MRTSTRRSTRRCCAIVYPMIKAANPEVQVLAGALAPTLAPPGSEWGMNDLDYLQAMYDAGAADYFDILAIHAYGWHFDPDEPADAGGGQLPPHGTAARDHGAQRRRRTSRP